MNALINEVPSGDDLGGSELVGNPVHMVVRRQLAKMSAILTVETWIAPILSVVSIVSIVGAKDEGHEVDVFNGGRGACAGWLRRRAGAPVADALMPVPLEEPVALPSAGNCYGYDAMDATTLGWRGAWSPELSGYGAYSFTDWQGEAFYPTDLLPTPTDPGDYQVNDLLQTSSVRTSAFLGPGGTRKDADGKPAPILFQHSVQGKLGLFYDTGFAGGTAQFSPTSIAIDGTPTVRQRGQLGFVDADLSGVPLNVELGAQLPRTGLGHLQMYTELLTDNLDDDVDDGLTARCAYVRWLNNSQNATLTVGKADTLFGDLGCSPNLMTVGSIPIGASGIAKNGISVISSSHFWHNISHSGDFLEFAIAAEDQSGLKDVQFTPTTAAVLNRYPTFVTRLRYAAEKTRFDSYQIAALVRPIGVEDVNFVEHFETGWGVSGVGRFRLPWGLLDAAYAGVTAGEGVGGYIFNGTPAATMPTPTTLVTLQNFGTFGGYQHFWWVEDGHANFSSNLIFGYVCGDAAAADGSRDSDAGRSQRYLEPVGANRLRRRVPVRAA